MIVCLCNALSDRDIKRIAQEGGVENGEEAYCALGCTFQCGACRCLADQLVMDNQTSPADALIAAE